MPLLSVVAARRLTAPTLNACPSVGATVRRALAVGRSRRMNSVVFSINGASCGSEYVACANAAGPPAIVCSNDGATPAQAEKKVSSSLNHEACVLATGATWEEIRSSAGNRLRKSVCGAARLCSTGIALVTSGRSVEIVSLSPRPLPARPSPKLIVLF